MKFYRVQDHNNCGPYGSVQDCLDEMLDAHNSGHWEGTHPNVWVEFRDEFVSGVHVCGFTSMQRLTDWFGGFGDDLHQAGFCIAVYEVPASSVVEATHQDIANLEDLSWGNMVDLIYAEGI